MANFFKSLFSGKPKNPDHDPVRDKQERKFEILKYDGLRAQKMKKAEYALKCFTGALAIKEDYETYGYLATLYVSLGSLDKAEEVYTRMIAMEPQWYEPLLYRANVRYMEDKLAEAIKDCEKVIELDSGNAAAYLLEGKAYLGLKEYVSAVASLTKSLTINSEDKDAYLTRASVLYKMKQYRAALEDINKVLDLDPEEEFAYLQRGMISEEQGDEAGAEYDFKHVTKLNPFNEQAYICLGNLLMAHGRVKEAIDYFNEAIELNPGSAEAYRERGRAKLLDGDQEGSLEDMKRALEINPEEHKKIHGQYDNQADTSNRTGLPV